MSLNAYSLQLIFIFLNILQPQKLRGKKLCLQRPYFLRRKSKKRQKTKLNCKFIRTNTSKSYDEDYEIDRIETFISKFQDMQLKKLEKGSNKKKIKEL